MAPPTAIVVAVLWAVGAGEPPPAAPAIPVRVTGCPEQLGAILPALLNLEIQVLRRERGATRGLPDGIDVRCAGDGALVEITVAGIRRTSSIPLGALAAEHRARALALAAAELVDALAAGAVAAMPSPASTSALVVPALPPPSVPPVAADRSTDAPSVPAPPGPTVLAGGTAEWLGRPAAVLLGARIAYQHPLSRLFAPMLSLDGSIGDVTAPSGRVSARTLGLGAHLFLRTSARGLRLEVGPGVRLGWAQVAGRPAASSSLEGRALSAWWGGPELRLRASTTSRRGAHVALELGGGIVALPVRGLVDGGVAAYAIEGGWLSLSLQLGLDLGDG